jgi:hypothetical protein
VFLEVEIVIGLQPLLGVLLSDRPAVNDALAGAREINSVHVKP